MLKYILSRSFYSISKTKEKFKNSFLYYFISSLNKWQVKYFLSCNVHSYMSGWPFPKFSNLYMTIHALTRWHWPGHLTFKLREGDVFAKSTSIIRGDDEENPQPKLYMLWSKMSCKDIAFREAFGGHVCSIPHVHRFVSQNSCTIGS